VNVASSQIAGESLSEVTEANSTTVTVRLSLSGLSLQPGLLLQQSGLSSSFTVRVTVFGPAVFHFVVNDVAIPDDGKPPLADQERVLIWLSASVEVQVKVAS